MNPQPDPRLAPAPLFRDPIYDGAADPTLIWNRQEKTWWLLYTQRRASVDCQKFAWVHGTRIGVASSKDGQSWLYRGTLEGLEFERGHNTFWAPEIFWYQAAYHMFVSYLRGVPSDRSGDCSMVHMTSENLWDWKLVNVLPLVSNRVLDACVHPLPDGRWRMWYKDEAHRSLIYYAESMNLVNWFPYGAAIFDRPQEGPNVFVFLEDWWMVTDPWNGLGVYRSTDAGTTWRRQENILDQPGQRVDDGALAHHADVLVNGGRAFIFYHTHPGEQPGSQETFPDGILPFAQRRSSIQAAELHVVNDKLTCDRDEPFNISLVPPED